MICKIEQMYDNWVYFKLINAEIHNIPVYALFLYSEKQSTKRIYLNQNGVLPDIGAKVMIHNIP